jgi:hypothetical protein
MGRHSTGEPGTRGPVRRPLYARALRLRHIAPGSVLCFLFFEGMIGLTIVLALVGFVTWWAVLVVPICVAAMVKLNDVVAGRLESKAGQSRGRPHTRPAVAPRQARPTAGRDASSRDAASGGAAGRGAARPEPPAVAAGVTTAKPTAARRPTGATPQAISPAGATPRGAAPARATPTGVTPAVAPPAVAPPTDASAPPINASAPPIDAPASRSTAASRAGAVPPAAAVPPRSGTSAAAAKAPTAPHEPGPGRRARKAPAGIEPAVAPTNAEPPTATDTADDPTPNSRRTPSAPSTSPATAPGIPAKRSTARSASSGDGTDAGPATAGGVHATPGADTRHTSGSRKRTRRAENAGATSNELGPGTEPDALVDFLSDIQDDGVPLSPRAPAKPGAPELPADSGAIETQEQIDQPRARRGRAGRDTHE